MPITFDGKSFHLKNAGMSYIIRLAAGKYPLHQYWGLPVRKVSDDLMNRMTGYTDENFSLNQAPLDALPQECPVLGSGDMREGILQVDNADGTHMLDLRYTGYEIIPGKPELPGLPSARGENAETLTISLLDEYSGLKVELLYTVYSDLNIIARSMRIINGGKEAVTLQKALSAGVDFERAEGRLLTLSGAWAREREMVFRPLVPGEMGVSSLRGASSLQTSPFMALLGPDANEHQGDVYAFALCYSGNFTAKTAIDQYGTARAMIGIAPENFCWFLAPGDSFQTPEAYLCYSAEGLNGMSASFHRLVHRYIVSGPYAKTKRPLLINNWEATYFDFNEEKLLTLAQKAKDAGIDLFVLDDGWFGKRDNDHCSLGDWVEDRRKLPNGIQGLGEKLHAMGLKFGLWMEPEMVSPDSDLYRAHPDWCLHAGGRARIETRWQLTLDLARPDVQDYIVGAVSDALQRGRMDYIKWDMNKNFISIGSDELPPERMKELGHRYMLGLYSVLRRITAAFPNVLFESCSSGGGRFDLGMLCFMPQTWCSDDTDAHMRCRIQYGTSLVFPPSTMGAHVSAVPNHQCGRMSPLFTRAAIAMGGTYGYELDLCKLPDEEMDEIRAMNEKVHALQPLLLYGTFIRLLSPFEGNETAWMSVSEDKREALVTHVFDQRRPNEKPKLLKLRGLDPEKDYRIEESGAVWGGDELMQNGLPLKDPWNDYFAQQYHLIAVE